MRSKIYIAGPISGMPGQNIDNFYNAEASLVKKGFEVYNPFEVVRGHGLDRKNFTDDISFWRACMNCCIPFVGLADTIYLLKGWENSSGARVELMKALERFKEVVISDKF